jgi:GWxTD domain-containing protein
MKKYIVILILFSVFFASFGQKASLRAYLSYAAFYAPDNGPYLETYLSILGKSVQFVKNENGKFQGTVMVTMLFRQNDTIKEFRKYDLNTAEVEDTAHIDFVVFDQQRIALADGKYDLELQIADKYRDLPPFKATDKVELNFDARKITFSDIELVESFSKATETSLMAKSGYDFIPYQDYYYPQSSKRIIFYSEIYNTAAILGSENQFVVASSIQSVETGKPIDNYFRIKRETANHANVVFSEFDISDLPSGNFNLVISVRDKENKEIASQRRFIQRSNPGIKFNTVTLQNVNIANSFVSLLNNPDTLREYLRMCFPIASANEKLFINFNLAGSNLITMQQFFYNFWSQRNQADPEGAWINYFNIVLGVEHEFASTNKKGYETDRGRVYLQYGPPNERIKETMNPDSYPYEVWHYYQIANQTNMRFVFYTRDLAVNDYIILHSSVIGEIKNVNWQYDLKRSEHDLRPKDTDNSLYRSPYENDNFGEHSGENYNFRR